MKLFHVWKWESLENLPLLLGFVAAARLWGSNIPAGLAVLALGMGLGVYITRRVQPYLHKNRPYVPWISTVLNFLLFVALAVPFLYYFRWDAVWAIWKTDLLGGAAAAVLLTFVQSLHWNGPKSRMFLHGAAMLAAFPVIMLGIRFIIAMDSWGLTIISTILLALFASLIIGLIDYQEMYRK